MPRTKLRDALLSESKSVSNIRLYQGRLTDGHVPSLEEAFETYLRVRSLRPSTIDGYRQSFVVLSNWMKKDLNSISTQDVVEKMLMVTQLHGPGAANKTFRSLRAVYNFAMHYYEGSEGQPAVPRNPVKKLSDMRIWNVLLRRQTIILKHQLPLWYKAVMSIEYPATRDMVLFLWLTGCRVGEARNLKWSDVDVDAGIVEFKETKSHVPCVIPVSSFVQEILARRHDSRDEKSPYVFNNKNRPDKPLSNNYTGYRRVCTKLGFAWKFHDLRRGFVTRAVALQIPDMVAKRLVNHAQTSNVTAGYAVLDPEDLRPATELITKTFLQMAGCNSQKRGYRSIVRGDATHVTAPEILSIEGGFAMTISKGGMNL